MSKHSVSEVVEYLQRFAPLGLAADWDNVGLLLGDRRATVRRIMTCLTVTPEVVAEAVSDGVHLIVSHHPILFRGAKRLPSSNAEGQLVLALAGANVAVYRPHTAFDNTEGGINDIISRRLKLERVVSLRNVEDDKRCKIVVMTPEEDVERVSSAMFAAGAGVIGQYRQCSFRIPGTGTFFGSDESNPTKGKKGQREEVTEYRLEVVCQERLVGRVISALREAHSYEEPAYDVYPLKPEMRTIGAGRIGSLRTKTPLKKLARTVKQRLNAGKLQVVGEAEGDVQRVAVVCGAGGEFFYDAVRARADVFITGEMRFHDLLAAQAQGVALILPGHYATERCGIEELASLLQERWPDLEVWPSRRESDPIQVL